ncbi:MAG: DNA lyase [Anaerolineae bacterium]|nr:DNA lyase [Anaerolineae bacterium]
MRLWSLHPAYLDARGLVPCWREGLLARKVLKGETRGYRHHPQLERFRAQSDPVAVLDLYLLAIWEEAAQRGYAFDRQKIAPGAAGIKLTVTDGQLAYELQHLKAKLRARDIACYQKLAGIVAPLPHPLFAVRQGDIEPWERVSGQRLKVIFKGIHH